MSDAPFGPPTDIDAGDPADAAVPVPDPPAPALDASPAAFQPPDPTGAVPMPPPGPAMGLTTGSTTNRAKLIAAGVAAVLVLGGAFAALRGGGTSSVKVLGIKADSELLTTAWTDVQAQLDEAGGTSAEDSGCRWAVEAPEPDDGLIYDRAVCGPFRLPADPTVTQWVALHADLAATGVGNEPDLFLSASDGVAYSTNDLDDLAIHDPIDPTTTVEPPATRTVIDGLAVADIDDMIASADEQLADLAAVFKSTGTPITMPEEAGCWFDVETAAFVTCGPMVTVDGDVQEPWRILPVGATPVSPSWTHQGNAGLEMSMDEYTSTTSEGPAEDATRPDGRAVPDTADLALPDPPAQLAGASFELTPEQAATLRFTDFGTTISGPGFSARLVASTTTDRIGTGSSALIAADGEEFVVAKIQSQESRLFSGSSQPSLGVFVVGDARLSIENWTQIQQPLEDNVATTYAVSVPIDAPISLAVQAYNKDQSISLRDGVATTFGPYSDSGPMSAQVVVSATTTWSRASGETGVDTYTQSYLVDGAWLRGWDDHGTWAPDGGAFVVVSTARGDATSDQHYCYRNLVITPVLTLADGTTTAGVEGEGYWTFAVPADWRTGQVVFNASGQPDPSLVDACTPWTAAPVPVDIAFP